MLGICQTVSNSKSQSSIRHKVRKLRAKVKTIIPNDICQMHKKRNKKVEKINDRKNQQIELTKKPHSKQFCIQNCRSINNLIWKTGLIRIQQWYTSDEDKKLKKKFNQTYQFNKLKKQEIQQINQDKIYYLGQKNIDAYNEFLKTLKLKIYEDSLNRNNFVGSVKSQKKIDFKSQVNQKAFVSISLWDQTNDMIQQKNNLKQPKLKFKSRFTDYKMTCSSSSFTNQIKRHKDSITSLSKWKTQKNVITNAKRVSVSQTFQRRGKQRASQKITQQIIKQRKQQIQQDQKQRREFQKLRMDMQMKKAEQNQREMKQKLFLKIRQQQNQDKEKFQKTLKKKSILMKKGEIVKIDQQLRSIMVRRRQNRQENGRSNSCIVQQRSVDNVSEL